MKLRKTIAVALILFATALFLFAQSLPTEGDTTKHNPMEFLGMGPEMFQDRASAWVEATGNVAEKIIAKLGILAAAIILAVKNINAQRAKKEQDDRIDRVDARVAQNADRIHEVALAVPVPPANTSPTGTPIPGDPIPGAEQK